jgi:hypothetical protein
MALINEAFRFYYIANNFTTGLTDVSVQILDPNNTIWGSFICTESTRTGIYYYDYTPLVKGQYVFEADSVVSPKKFVQIQDFWDASSAPTSTIPFADF